VVSKHHHHNNNNSMETEQQRLEQHRCLVEATRGKGARGSSSCPMLPRVLRQHIAWMLLPKHPRSNLVYVKQHMWELLPSLLKQQSDNLLPIPKIITVLQTDAQTTLRKHHPSSRKLIWKVFTRQSGDWEVRRDPWASVTYGLSSSPLVEIGLLASGEWRWISGPQQQLWLSRHLFCHQLQTIVELARTVDEQLRVAAGTPVDMIHIRLDPNLIERVKTLPLWMRRNLASSYSMCPQLQPRWKEFRFLIIPWRNMVFMTSALLALGVVAWRWTIGVDPYAWAQPRYLWDATHEVLPGDRLVPIATKLWLAFWNPATVAMGLAAAGFVLNLVDMSLDQLPTYPPHILRHYPTFPFREPPANAAFIFQMWYQFRVSLYQWRRRKTSWIRKTCDGLTMLLFATSLLVLTYMVAFKALKFMVD